MLSRPAFNSDDYSHTRPGIRHDNRIGDNPTPRHRIRMRPFGNREVRRPPNRNRAGGGIVCQVWIRCVTRDRNRVHDAPTRRRPHGSTDKDGGGRLVRQETAQKAAP